MMGAKEAGCVLSLVHTCKAAARAVDNGMTGAAGAGQLHTHLTGFHADQHAFWVEVRLNGVNDLRRELLLELGAAAEFAD